MAPVLSTEATKHLAPEYRCRNVCFTVYGSDDFLASRFEILKLWGQVTYLVMGMEKCPDTGRMHLQSYVEFKTSVAASTFYKKLGVHCHCETRMGTSVQAADYCKKDGLFDEFGELSHQGARLSLADVKAAVEDGKPMRELTGIASNLQEIRMAEVLLKYHEPTRPVGPVDVIWCHGDHAVDKVYALECNPDDMYTPLSLESWDGYDGHSVVHLPLDELPSVCKLRRFIDKYPFKLNCKHGFRQALYSKIYVTSQAHIEQYPPAALNWLLKYLGTVYSCG